MRRTKAKAAADKRTLALAEGGSSRPTGGACRELDPRPPATRRRGFDLTLPKAPRRASTVENDSISEG